MYTHMDYLCVTMATRVVQQKEEMTSLLKQSHVDAFLWIQKHRGALRSQRLAERHKKQSDVRSFCAVMFGFCCCLNLKNQDTKTLCRDLIKQQ